MHIVCSVLETGKHSTNSFCQEEKLLERFMINLHDTVGYPQATLSSGHWLSRHISVMLN